MKFLFKLQLLAMAFLPLAVSAKWNDPTLVMGKNQVKLGETVEMSYYNAPSDASLVIYSQTGSVAAPAVRKTVGEGKGKVSLTIPESCGSHGYYAAVCQGSGTEAKVVSNTVFFLGSTASDAFKLSADKEVYVRGGTITVKYENAPACSGDRIVVYPMSYTLLAEDNTAFTAPVASAKVTETAGETTFKLTDNGYYTIYYILDGKYTTLFDGVDIMVGTPVTLSASKSKYIPEEEVTISFTGASKKYADWIGVFPFSSDVTTAEPLYTIDVKGVSKDDVTIPAGVLGAGSYRIASFYKGGRDRSVSSMPRITVAVGDNSLQYSDAETEYYYNIICASDNKCMTTEAVASSTADLKSMKLVTFETQNEYAQWKLVKRENGKIDVVNRATGDCILTLSYLQSGVNYTRMGKNNESSNGLTFTHLGDNQYSICGVEEDGVLRYLSNVTVGEDADALNLSVNTNFAWKLVLAETVVTGINGVEQPSESIKVVDGKIVTGGNTEYTVWNAEGVQMDKQSVLPAGVYVVRLADGRSVKISVK